MKPELKKILSLSSVEAAPRLLGWRLCRQLPKGVIKAKIVEVEAYNQADPASHSYRGLTKRTWPMFESGGRLYVYFTYGMHYCLNIVVGQKGVGEAVLIRAAEPRIGLDIMERNRGPVGELNLTNGPGKLAQAFGITDTRLSGEQLSKAGIWLEPPTEMLTPDDIQKSPRVGIRLATDQPWRFYLKHNRFVSKPSVSI